jgi:putative membrane protein
VLRIRLHYSEACQAAAKELQRDLEKVRSLKPFFGLNEIHTAQQAHAVQRSLWETAGLIPSFKVSGLASGEPSFTMLFNHETWTQYTGMSPFMRWVRTLWTWRHSTVLASVWPICLLAALLGTAFASLPQRFLPRTSPVPLTLMGSAIGLVLVFRTNNLYSRLSEARQLWGKAVFLVRQAAQTMASSLLFDPTLPAEKAQSAHDAATRCGRYLAAWAWELNAKLTGKGDGSVGKTRDLMPGEDTEILEALLPPSEASFIAASRSRPVALLGSMRRLLHEQLKKGALHPTVFRKLDEDLRELDLVMGGCERIFSSPVPPTMSRHAIRSLCLWLAMLPIVLAGSMHPLSVGMWCLVTSYIFVGIEEVGAQVEQPFELMPMSRLCNAIMFSLEEAFAVPPDATET